MKEQQQQISTPMELPPLPAKHDDWIAHISSHPDKSLPELIAPYKEYDANLREVFAQQPNHPAIGIPNVVPIFSGHERELKVRARNLADETEAERQRYIMPLSKAERKPNGSPAVVTSLSDFQTNFQLFSESSLVDLDWSNVVAAGSSVVTSLLPVSEQHKSSKRALREYYHQKLAPASDVDLFLYGLSEEQAVEKIKQIEQRIKDSILTETTTIRTKNAITIASQYPTRHVQIVLRIYRSISEILTGFDVDCSCVAYDGKQVYASPRALAAFMTQVNTIDLTRRSPSYENRLSKYARRGFEVYWPLLDRSRIDPTLFERSFGRTLGLARLLVLEKLPSSSVREAYVNERRTERGRPRIDRWPTRKLRGNMKDMHEEDVAEWVETDEVSDYHTFTIPYGPKYSARKIERLLYAKDLLLNAEWNRPKTRETALHRHPAFFGNATDVIGDCCGYCPKPATPEEEEIAAEEGKIYVSGNLSFMKDDPGRQAIGSFHPLTDDDWTDMAYVGNTARLCRAIVDCDLEHVQDWLSQEGADPNQRDYTGRTPLHLAVTTSTLEIVQALIDSGARLVSRLFDGKTALHLAAMHGETEMARALLTRSEFNEEKEAEKETRKQSQRQVPKEGSDVASAELEEENDTDGDEADSFDEESENDDAMTEGSFVKIRNQEMSSHDPLPEDADGEPDIYDINVLAWDTPVSALHLAIANGHVHTVKMLVQDFGADVLLPIKLVNSHDKSPRAAILPLVLALHLPPEKAKEMTKLLISLGASPAQADVDHMTALSYFAAYGKDLVQTMISSNRPAAERAVNHLSWSNSVYRPDAKSILTTAINGRDPAAVEALLELGAKPEVDFDTYISSVKSNVHMGRDTERNTSYFRLGFEQPVFSALRSDLPSVIQMLLDAGADINCLSENAWNKRQYPDQLQNDAGTLLDLVRKRIESLRVFTTMGKIGGVDGNLTSTGWVDNINYYAPVEPIPLQDGSHYLQDYTPGTYSHLVVRKQIEDARTKYEKDLKTYQEWIEPEKEPKGTAEKKAAVKSLFEEFEALERRLVERGAKTLEELHPELAGPEIPGPDHYRPYRENPKPWSQNLTFRLPDLTEERRKAYIKLFEACWEGDLVTIKKFTLAIWGDNQTPLQIAVQDSEGFSPLSVALLRKHYEIATAILEIAQAQYNPEQKPSARHTIQQEDEDDSSTDGGQDEIDIFSEIVDDQFTIENVGEVQSQVRSTIKPLEMVNWVCSMFEFLANDGSPSRLEIPGGDQNQEKRGKNIGQPRNLFQFAAYWDDANLFEFLISKCEEYTRLDSSASDDTSRKFFTFSELDFLYTISLGRVQLLEKIIKRTGAGFPLNDLVEKSGIEIPMKPEYYQGLSVHGKKRADWANAGRNTSGKVRDMQHPPLLCAAHHGNLQSVEWFLSDSPLRCYLQFADSHHDDIRVQNLAKTKGGLEASVSKWLGLNSHLLLHCVVLSRKSEETSYLLRQLCKSHPEALEKRSVSGMTPLHLAFALHRVEMAKILIEAGADQTTRNNEGNNIVHSILEFYQSCKVKTSVLRGILDLIDTRLIPSLFLERTQSAPGAATPLARWVHVNVQSREYSFDKERHEETLKLLLEFSKGEDLGIINGDGDTPVHAVVRYGADTLLRIMLDQRPETLFFENASGRTPFEIAEDSYLSGEVFSNPPPLSPPQRPTNPYLFGVLRRDPESFIESPEEYRSSIAKSLHICRDSASKQSEGHRRRLVSLVEANEVAKRLAARTETRYVRAQLGEQQVTEGEDEEKTPRSDEVSEWFYYELRSVP
ncbi:hypothetical protein COCMIDRAFT_38672 [Bipolaris oryzae ATCC 44560]|uniref:Peptidase A2 domain-containing protein n=1 Tax=Bipolaris oryzae ATCC 44560 TaxID=930090 RepID=W6Z142_COCMI|nr:uncharacterized protein COCMIDRAFT_38672 [Bipolaris oryzae ATCC 44560]EUC43413.1 hypothetical protein COCMIDRAFT_38672 [Bipolaris oryzae ATCC 44560]